MAERRMYAKTIVLSDAFLDMPSSARCLYFTLGMLADDDGFVNSPRSVMRQCGASDDDMKILIAKKFVLIFDSGVIVIKHWRVHNYIQKDRYKETKYLDEKSQIHLSNDGIYHYGEQLSEPAENDVSDLDTECIHRLGKDRLELGKVSLGKAGNSNIQSTKEVQDKPLPACPYNNIPSDVYNELVEKYGKEFVDKKAERAKSPDALRKWCEQDFKPSSVKPAESFKTDHDADELEYLKSIYEKVKQGGKHENTDEKP